MRNLRIVITAPTLFARTVLGYAFTEPPVDSPDYTRTYTLGQTVFITWNQTVSAWPLVHLRLDPLSATNIFEYGVTYAILIDNATNTGSFEWTIGENDNVTLDLIETNPRMFFQLNDATGVDKFTLDSRAFLVLGSGQNTASTSTTMSSMIPASTSPAPPPQGISQAGKVGVGIGIPFFVMCLSLIAFSIFKLRTKKGSRGGSGINEYRSELENAANQTHRNTVVLYGSNGQGPRQELPEK